MPVLRRIRLTWVAATFALAAAPQAPVDLHLKPGQPVERPIQTAEVHRYRISLRTGDFVRGTVKQRDVTLTVKAYFPDGSKVRAFSGPAKGSTAFRFVGEIPGDYILELTATAANGGSYVVTLDPIQPMAERLKIRPDEPFRSPRIVRLEKELAGGNSDALIESFWQEVGREGAPLVEKDDGKTALVTFLWRARFETYNVLVVWSPYSQEHPDDYQMARLGQTDIWYKTLKVPHGARFRYQLSPNDTLSRASNAQRFATAQYDPLNPRRRPDNPNLTKYEVSSIAELPGAPPQPWAERNPGVPAGKIERQRFRSEIMGNEREVIVYTPPAYAAGGDSNNLVLLFDATTYTTDVPVPVTLDNLIARGKVASTVVVLVNYPKPDARSEELLANPQFADLIMKELLPWVRQHYRVTADPRQTVVGGLSYGGFAAAFFGLRYPEVFGNVIAQSGSFWWGPGASDATQRNWMAGQWLTAPVSRTNFFLEAGTFENDIRGEGGQILETTRNLRDVLLARGYKVTWQEFAGGHDTIHWRGSIADALMAVLGQK